MSAKPTFTVQNRAESGKGVARKLRQKGLIPAVCYGHNAESTGVIADPSELYKLLTGERRTNIVFELAIEGGNTYENVMVRDYQINPIRQELVHADFVVVDPAKPVTVTVPVTAEGRPKGVREGGSLEMVRAEVPVMTRPADIPVYVAHDVSDLGLEQTLLASDLILPEGVEPAFNVDYAVARVAVPRGAQAEDEVEEGLGAVPAAGAGEEEAEA